MVSPLPYACMRSGSTSSAGQIHGSLQVPLSFLHPARHCKSGHERVQGKDVNPVVLLHPARCLHLYRRAVADFHALGFSSSLLLPDIIQGQGEINGKNVIIALYKIPFVKPACQTGHCLNNSPSSYRADRAHAAAVANELAKGTICHA